MNFIKHKYKPSDFIKLIDHKHLYDIFISILDSDLDKYIYNNIININIFANI